MRKVIVVLALALASTVASAAGPGTAKLGFVDIQRTLNETKVGQTAKKKLESEKNEKQKQVNDKKQAFDKQYADYDKQKQILKPEAAAAREKELQEQYVELQQMFVQLQQDLSKKEAQLFRDILTRAQPVIENIAKRDGYTAIIARDSVLWADATSDITDEVNKRLDAGEGAQPKPEAPAPKTDPKAPAPKPGKK